MPLHSLKNRQTLKNFLAQLARREGQQVEALNYIFCSDDYLLGINREHLNHDYYTDIITFQLSEKKQPIVADIYISVDRVKENAASFGTTLKQELHRVIFHGLLHTCGYRDKTKTEQTIMRKKEDEYLNRYFVPRGTNAQ